MALMGGKGGGNSALAAKPNLLSALRVQTSSYGQVIPLLYGQNRIAARLIWAGDFQAIPHTSTTKVGGKGLGSGGGNAIANTTYTYQTAVAMALCQGPILNIHNIWDTKGKLTMLTATVPFTVPGGGGGITVTPPGTGNFHSHKGVSRGDAFSFSQNDFGSDGSIPFSGTQQTPMTQVGSSPGAGQYVMVTSASPTTITGATNASPIAITDVAHGYVTGQQVTISGVLGNTAANGSWTITVINANSFSLNGSTGNGAYTSGGTALLQLPSFIFAAADATKVMTITYVYSVPDSNSNGQPQQKLSLTLFLGSRPQTPWSYLTSQHPGQDLGYNGIAYVAASAMDLGTSGALPNLSFEVLGVLPFGGGISDAEPSAIIADLLGNQFYAMAGVVVPGDLTQYRNFCTANGLFLSPVLDAQKAASAWIQEILDITNAAAVWSEGVLKIIPYGDTTAVGNGATFIPNTTPIYDLTTSDLLTPVLIKRPSVADVMNSVSVEFSNRANDYNIEIAEDKDDAMIALYGLRKDNPKQAHSITTTTVAKFAANLLRKRNVEIRATYTFTLGWQFNLLEPMDLVTLTIPELGYSKKPVRITAMREDDKGLIQVDAEDFPWGTATPTLYPHQPGTGFVAQANSDPGAISTPIIFEANDRLSLTGNYEVWLGVCGPTVAITGVSYPTPPPLPPSPIQITAANHGYKTGQKTTISGVGGITAANGTWTVTVVDPNNFTLNGSIGSGTYTSGGVAVNQDWGGCHVWVSPDNSNYVQIGTMYGPSRMGVLTAQLVSSADPDTTHTLAVDVTQSTGILNGGSASDADNFRTLCYVDGELISFQAATLTSAYHYNLATRLHRGVFGSPITTHNIGSVFLRLDDGVFVWEADPTLVGTTIFFKFTSFNRMGLMEQSLANATAYSFAFNGTFGNIGDPPANNATVDSTFISGTADNIRIYGASVGSSYTAWKRDQTQRTIPAQTLTLDNRGTAIQVSTNYWVSYDFNQATHVAWINLNEYVQAIGRGQMRIGLVGTVSAAGTGGSTGGQGTSPGGGGSGAPGRPLPGL